MGGASGHGPDKYIIAQETTDLLDFYKKRQKWFLYLPKFLVEKMYFNSNFTYLIHKK